MEKLKRDKIIDKLIDDDIDTVTEHYDVTYLSDILREGMKGYRNFTDEELKNEYQERFSVKIEVEKYNMKTKKTLKETLEKESLIALQENVFKYEHLMWQMVEKGLKTLTIQELREFLGIEFKTE